MEENDLLLSGIQHFAFCRRQWALIHMEQLWAENVWTADGHFFHQRTHDETLTELRGNLLITRGLRVRSNRLKVTGVCDVVEFHASPDGVPLAGRQGLWQPYPVEYKRGAPKEHDADELQLCCQGLCLEEMLACSIPEGSLYYGEPRRRVKVIFSYELRAKVEDMLSAMHQHLQRGHIPNVRPHKGCRACSLQELCLPKLNKPISVYDYLNAYMEEGGL